MNRIDFSPEYLKSLKNTKEEAILAGDKYFYDGIICRNGHNFAKIVNDGGRCFLCKREKTKENAKNRRKEKGIIPKRKVVPLEKGKKYGNLTATGNFKIEQTNQRIKNRNLSYHEVICNCGKIIWIVSYNWGVSEQCPECCMKQLTNNNIKHSLSQNIIGQLFYSAKKRAKKSQLDFDIDIEDIIIPHHCPILDIELDTRQGVSSDRKPRYNAPSIDRINSSIGYVKGNIIILSYKANVLKNDGTSEEHNKVAEFMERMGVRK